MLKCAACGFEGGPEFENAPVYITRGKRKGEVARMETRRTGIPQWIRLAVEREFGFVRVGEDSGYGGRYDQPVALRACPKCGTVKADV